MVRNLHFLKKEKEKLEEGLEKTKTCNYKKYMTLLQAYLTVVQNVNQLEAFEQREREEELRKIEAEKIVQEAEAQIKEEDK